MENPVIAAGERQNNRIPIRRPIDIFNPCECGKRESRATYRNQRLCEHCLYEGWGIKLHD